MKQISEIELADLALSKEWRTVHLYEEHEQSDWIAENSKAIADIETGRTSKTLYGEWPRGWRSEMKAQASRRAMEKVIRKFREENTKEMDGVIWLIQEPS